MSLRLKLTIIFIVVALVPAIFVSILIFTDYKNSLEADRLTTLKDTVSFKAEKIETMLISLKHNIIIAQSFWNIKKNLPTLIRFSRDAANPEFVAAKKILDEQLQPMQEILGLDTIILLDNEGKLVYSSNPADTQKNFLNPLPDPGQIAFKEGKGGVYFTDIFFNKWEGDSLDMFITAPALDSKGLLIGVIVFDINTNPIYELIHDKTGLGSTGEVLIVKKIGNYALYLNPLRYDPEAALKKKIMIGGRLGVPAQEAAQGKIGAARSIDYRGKEVIAAWRHITSLGWGIVAKIDVKEAFNEISLLNHLLIIILIILSFIISIIAFILAHSISKPIKILSECAKKVSIGNFDCTVETNAKDEIGQLSRAFNNMTLDLKHTTTSIDNLNKEIAARKKAEEGIRRLASIVESSDDAIIGKDINYIITSWNKGAEHLYGYSEKEVLGKSIFIIVPEKYREELNISLQKIKDRQSVMHYETMRLKKDGTMVPVSLTISSIKDFTGNVTGISTIAHDITEHKKLEEVLQKYSEELQKEVEEKTRELKESHESLVRSEKLATLGKLSGFVSHELRNPLGVMKNVVYYLNMLGLGKDNAEVKENLDILSKEIQKSDKIINDLLEFSRIKKPVFYPGNINAIVEEVLNRLKISADIKLVKDLQADLPNIDIDALHIHQIFYNIAQNAMEAMEKSGTLNIKTARVGDFIEISFSDTGIGIPKENLDRIFEPLFSTKIKGSGLGLAICASLVSSHNGRIEVESEVSKGTTFKVKLPIKRG
jgi:PAS domain S-box-containing protein